ncbi:MAG: glycoside hydrolase [Oscillospiraceae bacterium]|nr:glycoside hydrolase [Oscillospiraceae bacterium]
MKEKKTTALLTAAMLSISALSFPAGSTAAAGTEIKAEFESGTLTDCENREPITWEKIDEDGFGNVCDMTGWSGDSYVYIDRKDAAATVTVNAPRDDYYALNICYIQCFGTPDNPNKTQYLLVNGESQGEVMFPFNSGKGWQELPAGYVHLNKGENTITIKSYWGYTFLDYVKLTDAPAYLTSFSPDEAPCNPDASPEARKLYAYLRSVYGKHILSGQQEYCGSHNYNKNALESQGRPIDYLVDNEAEFEYIQKTTGKQPAIRGIDFLFYNTTKAYEDDAPERVIAWYKDKGGIPTVTFHWNVPTEKGSSEVAFYVERTGNTPYTNFSAANAVKEGTWEHEKIDADLENLAKQLGKARDAGVPILFRPLHEAEGAWFWWGADGPEACKKLYRYMWDQLTNKYKLNNLLWIWTGSTSANAMNWYPGDEYVDFQGIDKYNAINNSEPNPSAISASFYSMVGQTEGRKMVVMSENDTIPSLDNLLKDKAAWLYFCPWYQRYLTELTTASELKKIYTSDYCITLDELPDWDTYEPETAPSTTKPAVTTKPADTTKTVTTTTAAVTTAAPVSTTTPATTPAKGNILEPTLLGDADCSGTVDVSDAVLIARFVTEDKNASISEQGLANADCDSTYGVTPDDITRVLLYIARQLSKDEFQSKR